LPVERDKFTEMFSHWYTDIFRHFYPNQKETYSWWSYRAWARVRNVGWRLDYFVVNNEYLLDVINIEYLTHVLWSDHCPVSLTIK
jgi:exodeoxyribonuclease-3